MKSLHLLHPDVPTPRRVSGFAAPLLILVIILLVGVGCRPAHEPGLNRSPSSLDAQSPQVRPTGQIYVTVRTRDMGTGEFVPDIPLVVTWSDSKGNHTARLRTDGNAVAPLLVPEVGVTIDVSIDPSVRAYTGGTKTTIRADSSIVDVRLLQVLR